MRNAELRADAELKARGLSEREIWCYWVVMRKKPPFAGWEWRTQERRILWWIKQTGKSRRTFWRTA